MVKNLHIYYSGSVQGVGFRYSALRVAESLGLTGWAKNLRDGRVEVMCEGAEDDLKEFLRKISDIFGGYIYNADVEWSDATNVFESFDVRYD